MDATGKTPAEIHQMADDERYLTAALRARYYKELSPDEGGP